MQILKKLLAAIIGVVIVVAGFWLYATHAHKSDRPVSDTEGPGKDIVLAEPDKQSIPSVLIPDLVGWGANEAPKAAPGMQVNRFATGLDHPRTMLPLPNGDVIVAETDHPVDRSEGGGLRRRVERQLYNKAGAGFDAPNTLILLRDANGDGVAEGRFTLRQEGLDSPSGLAWGAGKLYVANHNAVLAFDFQPGATSLAGAPTKIMDLPPAGNHWMRGLLLSADGNELYVAIGSASNIGENGMDAERGRAAIWQIDLKSGRKRQFAGGMRNPVGMDWNPATGELWSTVVERDMLGPDLVPDYMSNVPIGAQYGWPWYYWQDKQDTRVDVAMPLYLNEYIRKPEYALGAHATPLGLSFAPTGLRLGPDFANGAFIARHGSWNRNPLSGYDVIFVKFDERGNPVGKPVTVLSGFLKDGSHAHGRPTWVAFDKTGALLVSDDTAGIIWRVIVPGAAPSAGVKKVAEPVMEPPRELKGATEADFRRKFQEMMRGNQ